MTLQQLEYLIALDTHGQFSLAAEQCFVTQPSLSAMVKKLEDELGVTLFDRRKQPIVATDAGRRVIDQARVVLQEAEILRQIAHEEDTAPSGLLRAGVIPTVAPYLLPLFIEAFSANHPSIRLQLVENTTDNIVRMLKQDQLDVCILATMEDDTFFSTVPLYQEEFVAYAPHESSILSKRYVLAEDIDPDKVVLMEEGHCIRNQVVNLCSLHHAQSRLNNIYFEAGNLETLRRIVESQSGITILPQLALLDLDEDRMQHVRFFKPPAPMREISLVFNRRCHKMRLIEGLKDTILAHLPSYLKKIE